MYEWEREALGIATLGEIRDSVRVSFRIDLADMDRSAGWIATLFGPDFWKTWRVGLLRGSIAAIADQAVKAPHPVVFRLPAYVAATLHDVPEIWDCVAIVPAVIEDRALAFAVCGARGEEPTAEHLGPRQRWELVAPTDLVARLGLRDGQGLSVRLLDAIDHQPDPPHQR